MTPEEAHESHRVSSHGSDERVQSRSDHRDDVPWEAPRYFRYDILPRKKHIARLGQSSRDCVVFLELLLGYFPCRFCGGSRTSDNIPRRESDPDHSHHPEACDRSEVRWEIFFLVSGGGETGASYYPHLHWLRQRCDHYLSEVCDMKREKIRKKMSSELNMKKIKHCFLHAFFYRFLISIRINMDPFFLKFWKACDDLISAYDFLIKFLPHPFELIFLIIEYPWECRIDRHIEWENAVGRDIMDRHRIDRGNCLDPESLRISLNCKWREKRTVGDDDTPIFQYRLHDRMECLGARWCEEIRIRQREHLLRVPWLLLSEASDIFRDRRRSWLAHDSDFFFAESLREKCSELFCLSCLSWSDDALEDDIHDDTEKSKKLLAL